MNEESKAVWVVVDTYDGVESLQGIFSTEQRMLDYIDSLTHFQKVHREWYDITVDELEVK